MQVDERGPGAVVAHALHQLTRVRARVGGELVSGMAKIVKVDADQAGSGKRGHPDAAIEITVTKRLAVWAGEDESRRLTESVEMLAKVRHDEVRKGDHTTAGARFGRPLRRSRVGPEDRFCGAVRNDLGVPLTLEGPTRTMRGVPARWL